MSDIGLKNIQTDTLEILFREYTSYVVPFFQREYSWKKDHWSDLLEDVIKAKKLDKYHFFGFMTFRKEKDERVLIIEGQQRFTTAMVLIAVIRDMFYEFNDDYWKNLEELIKYKDPHSPSEPVSYKLILSEINKDFFQNYIQEVSEPHKKIERISTIPKLNLSNKEIFDCYKYFHSDLLKQIKNLSTDEKKIYLREIIVIVIRKFIVVRTEVTDSKAAFNIFQTLNDRGEDLNTTDLIKVYLLGIVDESWPDAKDKWDEIRETLSQQNTNAFFRHYWLSKEGVVKEKELLDEIELRITKKNQVFKFLDELKNEAEYYEALLNPIDTFWSKRGQEIVDLLTELQLLSKQQTLPLLMASCKEDKIPNKEFVKLIETCISFIFRYLTIAERENKELEKLFSETAIDIRKGEIRNTKDIILKFKRLYIDDETFINLFSKKEIKDLKVARYILSKIEEYHSENKEIVHKKITLEHILPKSPDQDWKIYLSDNGMDKDDYVNKIGNMTLLLQRPNREARNRIFTYKRDNIYKKETKLKINEKLTKITSWTASDIHNRQKWIAEIAAKVWFIDY